MVYKKRTLMPKLANYTNTSLKCSIDNFMALTIAVADIATDKGPRRRGDQLTLGFRGPSLTI